MNTTIQILHLASISIPVSIARDAGAWKASFVVNGKRVDVWSAGRKSDVLDDVRSIVGGGL